jgi:hypothetical protein
LKEHVGGTQWELREHVEKNTMFNKNPKRETNVLPREEYANSNYNIPLVFPM